jgi:hypothetical protein
MIYEHRVYTFHPGKLAEFWSIYQPEPLALQRRILGDLVGYFTVETGALNQVVHIWRYASFEDRLQRRAALMQEPVWQDYIRRVSPLMQKQESSILLPASFSPLQ